MSAWLQAKHVMVERIEMGRKEARRLEVLRQVSMDALMHAPWLRSTV